MATVPAVAYLGDRYYYLGELSRWTFPFYEWRTFSGGNIGDVAQNNLSGRKDGFDGNAGGSTYAEDPLSPQTVCKCTVNKDTVGGLYFGGSINTSNASKKGEVVYMGIEMLTPSDFDWTAVYNVPDESRNKFLRLRDMTPGGGSVGYNDTYIVRNPDAAGTGSQFEYIKEGENPGPFWRQVGNRSQDIVKDVWEKYQIAVHLSDEPGASGGKVEFFKDGEKFDEKTAKTLQDSDNNIGIAHFFTYFDDALATKTQSIFVRNAFVTNLHPAETDSQGNRRYDQ